MVLYIDKENVISMVNNRRDSRYYGCTDFLKQNLTIHCNFTRKEAEENDYLSFWLAEFDSNIKGEIKFLPEIDLYPPRPIKANFYNKYKEAVLSVYLLSDEHICDVIAQKNCIIIGKAGEEFSKIESLYLRDTEVMSTSINKWSDYLATLPITDLIIADNHYFKNRYVYDVNKNELIEFFAKIPIQSPLNVVIITSEKDTKELSNEFFKEECSKIKALVKDRTLSKNSKVTILTTNKTHDRSVITNYYRVKHGSCFHLKENGLKDDVTTEMKTHAIVNNWAITKSLLKTYQSIASNPVRFFGDLESNLLLFSN